MADTTNNRRNRPTPAGAAAAPVAPASSAPVAEGTVAPAESAPAGAATSPSIWKAEQLHGAIIVFPREGSEDSKGRLRPSLLLLADKGVNIPPRWGRLAPGSTGAGVRVLHGDKSVTDLLSQFDLIISPVGYSNGSVQGYVEELSKLAPGYLPESLQLQADLDAVRSGGALPSKAALWARLTPLLSNEADRKATAAAIWQYWQERAAAEAANGQDLF